MKPEKVSGDNSGGEGGGDEVEAMKN